MRNRASTLIDRAVELSFIKKEDHAEVIKLAQSLDLEHQHAVFDAWHVILFVGWLVASIGSYLLLAEAADRSPELAVLVSVTFAGSFLVFMRVFKRLQMRFGAALASLSVVKYVCAASAFASRVMALTPDDSLLLFGSTMMVVSFVFIFANGFPALILLFWFGTLLVLHTLIEPPDDEIFFLYAGWGTLLGSYLLNVFASRNYTFWLNKVGLVLLALGMREYVSPGVSIEPEYLLISLSLIGIAIFVGYPSFAFSGVVGLSTYIAFLVNIVFRDQGLLLGFILLIFGVVVCYCAVSWRKIVDSLNLGGRLRPKELPTPYMFGLD